MFFKIFQLLVILIILQTQSYAGKNENQTKIDFWTNTIDEILIRFRYNKLTNKLEMIQGSSEELQEKFKVEKPNLNISDKSVIKLSHFENPFEAKEHVINVTKGLENKLIAFTRTDVRKINQNNFNTTKQTAKNVTVPNKSQEKELTSEKKTVSSISENSDDSITDVKDDFIDFDLVKGLRSIDLTTSKIKLPTNNETFPQIHLLNIKNSSIDPCAYNCSKMPHIACGHNWSISPKCSHNAKVINLDKFQSLIIHQHNTFRNNLAGNLTKFEPAVRMGTTQWHNELAAYAQLNAMTCEDDHDFCHNTKDFKWTGQNLASHYWWGRKKDLSAIITKMISSWYSENTNADQSDIDKFHRVNGLNNEIITHFTSIINERNTHIGCAAVAEKKGRFSVIYLTCNYARNNIMNLPIYEKGPTASKCLTGVNPQYTNLCSINEIYNYNV